MHAGLKVCFYCAKNRLISMCGLHAGGHLMVRGQGYQLSFCAAMFLYILAACVSWSCGGGYVLRTHQREDLAERLRFYEALLLLVNRHNHRDEGHELHVHQ